MGENQCEVIYGSITDQVPIEIHKDGDVIKNLCEALQLKRASFSLANNETFLKTGQKLHNTAISVYNELVKASVEIDELKKQLQEAQGTIATMSNKSYAKAASQQPNKVNNNKPHPAHPMCYIKVVPKLVQATGESFCASGEATKKLISTIDLTNENVGVKGIWKAGGTGVTVGCRSQLDADKLLTIISNKIGDKVTASKPKMRNPTFSMLLASDKYVDKDTHESLKNEILKLNNLESSDDNPLKIVFSKKTPKGNSLVFMEVGPSNYKAIKSQSSRIYVGWELVKLREPKPVCQCFNCYKFWHKATVCHYEVAGQQVKRCPRCGGQHDGKNCNAPMCCPNCSDYNKYTKGNKHNHEHLATDPKCPIYMSAVKKAKMLINYD